MIQRLETLYYQCLRHIEQDLAPFHMLVGANGSVKRLFSMLLRFSGILCAMASMQRFTVGRVSCAI